MVLELHIWGPAFGLPSIDAQCLAAVYYLHKALPHKTWALIPSSDANVSPFGELPALRDGATWVAGFANIILYLRDISKGEYDLDRHLDAPQHADCAAFFSFIESRGQPLLDLSLYVSSDNYYTQTRPALGDILLWPDSWVVPHQLRDKAKKRSEHLGLSSLDVDTATDDKGEDVGLTAHIPKSLRKPRQTVTSMLGRNMQKNRFRLDAVTADFLDPLKEKLGNNQWLIGDSVSSADCLSIGYLALLQVPQLPQGWVKEALRAKYSRLSVWAKQEAAQVFGAPSDGTSTEEQNINGPMPTSDLPWKRKPERTLPQILQSVLDSCTSFVPVLGSTYRVTEIEHLPPDADGTLYRQKQTQLVRLHRQREVYVQMVASTFAIAGLVGYLSYKGLLHLPRPQAKPRGRHFGVAGSFLGLAG